MTCTWQRVGSTDGAIERSCVKEGDPFCKDHQFIVDVLEETESVTSDMREHWETALAPWQAQLRQLRILLEQADELTPSAFVKRIHEALPELHRAAMEAVIFTYINSGTTEERRENLRQPRQA